MTREEIIKLAREAGILEPIELLESNQWRQDTIRELERFAALVAAAEREACAKVCEAQENKVVQQHPARIEFDPHSVMARKCAAAIRARGQK